MSDAFMGFLPALESTEGGTALKIKAVPGASRTMISGLLGERLKVRVAAPPEGGKANEAIVELLAKILQTAKKRVCISAGTSSPTKTVVIHGMNPVEVNACLTKAIARARHR